MTAGVAAVRDCRVSFVCNQQFSLAGSAYLRGFQLAQLAARRFASVQLRRLSELDPDIQGEVLIFNKSCLKDAAGERVLEAVPSLRRRNACIADPLDALLPDALLAEFDGVMAASIGHADDLSRRLHRPVFLVHHHTDLRMPPPIADLPRARAAYFGELVNTRFVERLADRVDFIGVDTANALDVSWMRHLPYYNLHYCLRQVRSIDGFKPATKIFVAARMGAVAIVERGDREAARLLPPDYPFFAEAAELEQVRAVVERAIASFGRDDWRYAQDAMRAIDCYREESILDALQHMVSFYEASAGSGIGWRSASIAT